jgi:hypothetical protein
VQLTVDERRSTEPPHDQDPLLATDSLDEGAIHETPLVELEKDRIRFARRAFFTVARRLRDCARRRDRQQERER